MSRKRIFEIIEMAEDGDLVSEIYDCFMILLVILSLVPLAIKEDPPFFAVMDTIIAAIFIIDYILRWITADYKFKRKTVGAFAKYPFTPMAIVDLISILPSLGPVNDAFRLFRILRMLRAIRVLRVFKVFRYSSSFKILNNVLRDSKDSLMAVCAFAGGYILVSALIIFNVEPESFATFFDAVYWATVSLTTVGYGDIYPVTTAGRVIAMLSSLFGIAIVALPAGIITAGYMNELNKKK